MAGQRGDSFLSDVWSIPVPAPTGSDAAPFDNPALDATQRSADTTKQDGPPAAFSQRLIIEPDTGTWTVMGGTSIPDNKEVQSRQIWQLPRNGRWQRVARVGDEPQGRYASQVCYDPLWKEFYLFGGNPADPADKHKRLADFWRLRITP